MGGCSSQSSTVALPSSVAPFNSPPPLSPALPPLLALCRQQVRPKPAAPAAIPIAPAPPPPMMAAPQLLQRPVMLATKLTSSLPSAAPIHQVRIVNGQPCGKPGTAPLAGIVITTPVAAPVPNTAPVPVLATVSVPAPLPAAVLVPGPTPAQPIQISSLTAEPKVR